MRNLLGRTKIILVVIILFGLLLRLWKINSHPFPPDGDEIAFAYYGWSLLNYGTDEYGAKFPFSFSSIGDYKYPGLAYLNIIPAFFFKLSDLTTRFWGITSGVLAIPLIYLFCFYITKNKKASLCSAFIIAISPWSLIESRLGYENHPALTITLGGIILLLIYLGEIKIKKLNTEKKVALLGILLLIVTLFTYAAQRIFVPLYLSGFFLYSYIDKGFKKNRIKLFLTFLFILLISLSLFAIPNLRGRADQEIWKYTSEDSGKLEITYVAAGISEIRIPPRLTWLLQNKYSYSGLAFLQRYLNHFNPNFLFFEGEASDESIPGMGVLLFAEIILLPVGLFTLFQDKPKKSLLIFAWLLLAPIASALTRGGAHINRASLMIIPLAIFSGYGLCYLTSFKIKALNLLFLLAVGPFLLWSFAYALQQMFLIKTTNQPWYKQQVNKEITLKVLSLKDNYEAVAVTDDDYIFYLFYGRISPKEFQENSEILSLKENRWERVNRLYNIYFKMPFTCPLSGKENVLYVCKGHEIPQNSKLIDAIYYKDGVPAYTFIEFYPLSKRPSPLPELPDKLRYMVGVEKPDGNPDGIIPKENSGLW